MAAFGNSAFAHTALGQQVGQFFAKLSSTPAVAGALSVVGRWRKDAAGPAPAPAPVRDSFDSGSLEPSHTSPQHGSAPVLAPAQRFASGGIDVSGGRLRRGLAFGHDVQLPSVSEPRLPVARLNTAEKIARFAESTARRRGTQGRDSSAVNAALARAGIDTHTLAGAGFQKADALARHPLFEERFVARHALKDLSAGTVVVWGKSERHRTGHTAIALGDGREASDHIAKQRTDGRYDNNFGTARARTSNNYRVFALV